MSARSPGLTTRGSSSRSSDGIAVNGMDLIKWNDAGRIVEFKVMIRPLKAVNLIHQKMAAMLQKVRGNAERLSRISRSWQRLYSCEDCAMAGRPYRSGSWFTRFAKSTSRAAGSPATFCVAVAIILLWAVSGPLFGFSDTWQLVINTGTTIITFLMVFLIQNTQNRDTEAIQVKLDELIRAIRRAHRRCSISKSSTTRIWSASARTIASSRSRRARICAQANRTRMFAKWAARIARRRTPSVAGRRLSKLRRNRERAIHVVRRWQKRGR